MAKVRAAAAIVAVYLVGAIPDLAAGGSIVTGATLVVSTTAPSGLMEMATADLSLTAQAGKTAGTFTGTSGAAMKSVNKITDGPLMGNYDGMGYLKVGKFPAPVTRSGVSTATSSTVAVSGGTWTSSQAIKGNETVRSATDTLSVQVARPAEKNPPFGVATARIDDPWFFTTPDQSMVLHITVTLSLLPCRYGRSRSTRHPSGW